MTPLLEAEVALDARLQQTALTAAPGERIAIVGPNGSGKTSLLRALAGIDGTGVVRIDGVELSAAAPERRRALLSFLPASRDVTWPIPVRDVLALGLSRPNPSRIDDLLAGLHLQPLADRPVDQLSTGERTRALLGRALAPRPKLLLLDEPLSNLDPAWVLRILDLLDDAARARAAVIVSLHDLALLPRFSRVLLMHEGAVVTDSTPEALLDSPRFSEVFEIDPADTGGWKLRRPADPRSSR